MVRNFEDLLRFSLTVDAIVNTLCPGSLTLHLSRVDTKSSHFHGCIYDSDATNLRYVKRLTRSDTECRSYIRETRCGEFDYSPANHPLMETYPTLHFQSALLPNAMLRKLWRLIPRLWILVTDIGGGTHHVSTIYRGPAMWAIVNRAGFDVADFKSEAGLLEALSKIQACEGFDLQAWARFCEACMYACELDAANAANGPASREAAK